MDPVEVTIGEVHEARAWAVSSCLTESEVQDAESFSGGPEAPGA